MFHFPPDETTKETFPQQRDKTPLFCTLCKTKAIEQKWSK